MGSIKFSSFNGQGKRSCVLGHGWARRWWNHCLIKCERVCSSLVGWGRIEAHWFWGQGSWMRAIFSHLKTKFMLSFLAGQFVLKGDLDISLRTASKYNESKLLHLPNLRFWWALFTVPEQLHNFFFSDILPDEMTTSSSSYFSSGCPLLIGQRWPMNGENTKSTNNLAHPTPILSCLWVHLSSGSLLFTVSFTCHAICTHCMMFAAPGLMSVVQVVRDKSHQEVFKTGSLSVAERCCQTPHKTYTSP